MTAERTTLPVDNDRLATNSELFKCSGVDKSDTDPLEPACKSSTACLDGAAGEDQHRDGSPAERKVSTEPRQKIAGSQGRWRSAPESTRAKKEAGSRGPQLRVRVTPEVLNEFLCASYQDLVARARLRDPVSDQDAADRAHDAIEKILSTPPAVDTPFAAYAMLTMRSVNVDFIRARKKRGSAVGDRALADLPDDRTGADTVAAAREELMLVANALREMPSKELRVLLETVLSGESIPRVAKRLGLSRRTAQRRVQKARRVLGPRTP